MKMRKITSQNKTVFRCDNNLDNPINYQGFFYPSETDKTI